MLARAPDESGCEPDDEPPPRGGAAASGAGNGRAPDARGSASPGSGVPAGAGASCPGGPAEDGPTGASGNGVPVPPPDGQRNGASRADRSPRPRGAGDEPPSPLIAAGERRDAPSPARLTAGALVLAGTGTGPRGRRARTRGPGAGSIDSRPAAPDSQDLAFVASLRDMLVDGGPAVRGTTTPTLREHVRAGREATLVCLVVDASGSMGARRRLARVKGALIELLRDAYARRDRVAVIAFRDDAAQLLIAPGAPLALAAAALRGLATGGRTPLAAGLDAAERLIRREALREPDRRAIAVVLTDGRVADPAAAIPRAAARLGRAAAAVHVVDTEDGPVRLGLASALARAAGGEVHRLATPRASTGRAA